MLREGKGGLAKVQMMEKESKKIRSAMPEKVQEEQKEETEVRLEEMVGKQIRKIREETTSGRKHVSCRKRSKQVRRTRVLEDQTNSFRVLRQDEEVAKPPYCPTPSKVVVVGDSQVRNLGSRLTRKSRVACYPGARVAAIEDRLDLEGAKIYLLG